MEDLPSQQPVADPVPQSENALAGRESAMPEKRRTRVLVMDDEESILELTGRMLRCQGYDVETARDADTALARYRRAMEEGRRIDVVILDLTMAVGMGGLDAFKALKAFDPDVKAILSTGYSHESVVLNYQKHGIAGLALKPYKVRDLLDAVSAVAGR